MKGSYRYTEFSKWRCAIDFLLIALFCSAAARGLYPMIVSESIVVSDMVISIIDCILIVGVAKASNRERRFWEEKQRIAASELIHDIANPLAVISLNVDQLSSRRKGIPLADMKRCIEDVTLAVRQMKGYICNARQRLPQRKGAESFSPAEEMGHICRVIECAARNSDVTVQIHCLGDIVMIGNRSRFNQALSNVIANAFDAYEGKNACDTKKCVDISIEKQKNGSIEIIVADFGSGIQRSDIRSIFQPFFTTKSCEKGIGIGLCIAKRIVEREFSGKISVQSTYGLGTVFTVRFPKMPQARNA